MKECNAGYHTQVNTKLQHLLKTPYFRASLFYAGLWSVFALVFPFMNLELAERGFSGLQIGTIGSIRSVVIMLMAGVFSHIADRRGIRVKMLRSFMFLAAVGTVLFTFPTTYPVLIVAVIFMALWQSPLDSLGNSITVRMANRYHLDYGMMTFWGAVTFAAFNLVGGYVWEIIGLKWIYITGAGMYILVSLIAGKLEEPQSVEPAAEQDTAPLTSEVEPQHTKQPLKPMMVVFLASYFVFSLAFFNAFGFTGPILAMRGASNFIIGLVGTIVGIGGMIVRKTNSKMLARISIQDAMLISVVMGIIPILVYGWVESITALLLISLLRGAGWGMFSLCSIKFIDKQASVENASTLQSTLIMLNTLSNIIASTLSGYLYDTNPTLIFLISAIAAVVSFGIILVVRRLGKQETREQECANPTPLPSIGE